jgi:small subunit ribosomal protein S14
MAKAALIQRELKRDKLAAKFAKKYAEFKATASDVSKSPEEQMAARLGLNRCGITGRARGTYSQFGLGRMKVREMAFAGEIPGMTKASW